MQHHRKTPTTLATHLTLAALVIGQFWPVANTTAAPSQVPLLNRSNLTPAANVMLTLDDSGSMTYQYLPEKSFVLNGKTVNFPDDGKIFLHPSELPVNRFTFRTPYQDSGYTDNRMITAAPHTSLTDAMVLMQSQMRSPQVNRLYYNPYIRYIPWKTSDGRSYLDATPSKAWLLPQYLHPDQAPPANSTEFVSLVADTEHLANWYCRDQADWSQCDDNHAAYVSLKYNPALLYMLAAGGNPNDRSQYTYYNLNEVSTFSWPATEATARTDCALNTNETLRICSQQQERQNFANWFVFYRSRLFVAQGKIPEALAESLGDVRLGWGTIHPRKTGGTSPEWSSFEPDSDLDSAAHPSPSVQQGVRMLSESHLLRFTNWLRGLQTDRRTPTLHALYSVGEYFKRDDALSPWQNSLPATQNNPPLACRRSYHVMVTDGYYQTDSELNNANDNMFKDVFTSLNMSLPDIGNVDNDNTADETPNATFPIRKAPGSRSADGKLLTRNVFRDGLSGTLADHAMRLWLTDLQPNIDDRIEPLVGASNAALPTTAASELLKEAQGNPATWQHLTHYMIGFGVTGTLLKSDATLESMLAPNPTVGWPGSLNKVDDLWHAAVNSRGEYFSASDPEELQKSLQDALRNAGPMIQNEAGLATASSELKDGNLKYVPEYDARGWTGDIKAFELDGNGDVKRQVWSANEEVPGPTSRNIVIMQNVGSTRAGVPFRHDQLDDLTKASISEELVNVIRGSSVDAYRKRDPQHALPDYINSTPLLVKESLGISYASSSIVPGSATYQEYEARKNQRANGLIILGGNGGMVHAFNSATGTEQFAFIPQAAIPKLPLIAHKRYGRPDTPHQYVVDGQLNEADVYVAFSADSDTAPTWHNLVVGTMGAGGKSVYALSVPTNDPSTINATNAKWEATHEDMGYITSTPQIGYTPQGWKVFVGNGVDSTSGRTALLVIDVATGTVASVPVGPAAVGDTQHGLGGVTLARNAAGVVKAAYAGDSRGRLWRFDVGQTGVTVGYDGQPLFVARDAADKPQPISAAPMLIRHTRGGQVVVINTGRALYTTDVTDQSTQSAYGIWDQAAIDTLTNGVAPPNPTRSGLTQQTVTGLRIGQRANGDRRTFFATSRNAVNWDEMRGWYLDLIFPDTTATNTTYSHPKALYDPIPLEDVNPQNVVISSVKPATSEPSCDKGEDRGYGAILNGLTGGASLVKLDTDGDGAITENDGDETSYDYGGGAQRILRKKLRNTGDDDDDDETTACEKIAASIQEAKGDMKLIWDECQKDTGPVGKKIKDRIWRQLLNPPKP